MLEMLINAKKAERKPWELFFVGLFYASLSLFLVNWIFSKDPVLSKYSGILIVTFTVMFSMPFIYFTLRLEEKKAVEGKGPLNLLKEHEKAIQAFLWLFLGFVVAFSFCYVALSSSESFKAQIETYCMINRPSLYDSCVQQYSPSTTGFATSSQNIIPIFTNNFYVLLFTILFSFLFGAGAIFILAWNASIIAAAIGIYSQSSLSALPGGMLRYLIHGIPEIGSYFMGALAGGIVSMAIVRKDNYTDRFPSILQDSLNLVLIAIAILFLAALMEVYITPLLF